MIEFTVKKEDGIYNVAITSKGLADYLAKKSMDNYWKAAMQMLKSLPEDLRRKK